MLEDAFFSCVIQKLTVFVLTESWPHDQVLKEPTIYTAKGEWVKQFIKNSFTFLRYSQTLGKK